MLLVSVPATFFRRSRKSTLGLVFLWVMFLCWGALPSAHAAESTVVGNSCAAGANRSDWDTIFQCSGGAWKRAPYFFGSSADSCTSSLAGTVQWTGTSLQVCNGSTWSAVGSASAGLTGQSIISGWPDAIICTSNGASTYRYIFYLGGDETTDIWYESPYGGNSFRVNFSPTGSYVANVGLYDDGGAYDCVGKSISQLITSGQAFNFVNGGSSAGAMLDGTAAAPGLYFANDNNTGFYRPAADTLAIATNGTEVLRVTSTGSIGVGTTAPAASLDLHAKTDGLILPTGTSGQRSSTPVVGTMRYNTTLAAFEGYTATGWGSLGSATGTGLTGQSIISGWPDAIVCPSTASGFSSVYLMNVDRRAQAGALDVIYRLISNGSSGGDYYILFNPSGTYKSANLATGDCIDNAWSISQYISNGHAFNFVNGGSSAGAMLDGTAAAPGLYFANDNNTGFYRPAADTLAVATNGTEVLRVTSTGSIGVGTTAPAASLDLHTKTDSLILPTGTSG